MSKSFLTALAVVGVMGMSMTAAIGQTDNQTDRLMERTTSKFGANDSVFLMNALRGNAFEVAAAQIAKWNAGDRSVYLYADELMNAHMTASNDVMALTRNDVVWMDTFKIVKVDSTMTADTWYVTRTRHAMRRMDVDMGDIDPWAHITADQWNKLEHLKSLKGRAFDKAYTEMMVKDHYMTIKEWEKARERTLNPEVQSFIDNHLPTIQEHLAEARRLSYNYHDPFHFDRSWPWND